MAATKKTLLIEAQMKDLASKALRGMGGTLTKVASTGVKAFKAVGKGVRDFVVTLNQATQLVGAAARGMKKLATAMAKPAELAGIQEQSIARLNAALRVGGQLTEESSRALQENAAALQRVTRFGDEAIMPLQALLLQMGGLSAEQIPRATAATLDFAEAMGMDIVGAASLVAKSIGSSTNALTRYGIEIDNSLQGTARFEEIIGILETKVGGTAAAISDTFLGSLENLSNSFGDLLEKVGDFIIKNKTVQTAISAVQAKIESFAGSLEGNAEAHKIFSEILNQTATEIIPALLDGFAAMVETLGSLSSAFFNVSAMAKISRAYLKLFLNDLPGPMRVELDVWEMMDAINDIRDGTISLETGFMDMSVVAANSIRIVSNELRGLGESAAAPLTDLDELSPVVEKTKRSLEELGITAQNLPQVDIDWTADIPIAEQLAPAQAAINRTNKELARLGITAQNFPDIEIDWTSDLSIPEQIKSHLDEINEAQRELDPGLIVGMADVWDFWKGKVDIVTDAVRANIEEQRLAAEELAKFEAQVTASGERIGDALINAFSGAFAEQPQVWHEQFVNFGESVKDTLSRAFLEPIFGAESAFQGLFETIAEPFAALGDFINDNVFDPLFDGMKELGLGIWNTLKEYVFTPMLQSLSSFFTQKDVWRTADQAAEISTNAATQTAVVSTNTAAGAASTAAWAPAAVASSIATVGTAIAFGLLATALIRKAFASGGQVDGPGGEDNVPAMLTAGEYVIKKSSVNKLGIPFLERLNQTGEAGFFNQGGAVTVVQRYASGGEVQRGGMFGLGAQSQDSVQVNINIDAHDATGFDRLLAERRGDIVGMIQEGLSTRPNFRKQVQGVARRG